MSWAFPQKSAEKFNWHDGCLLRGVHLVPHQTKGAVGAVFWSPPTAPFRFRGRLPSYDPLSGREPQP